MKIKAIIFSLLTTLSINSIAQNIEVRIIGAREIAVLFELEGEMKFLVDSIEVDNGKFSINGDNYKLHTGFYRLSLSKNKWIDFIYDGDEVEIKTDAMNILDSLQVIKSLSNKLFYEFIQLNKEYKTKTELLQLILARYPKDDDYYLTTQQKLFELQEDYLEFVNPSIPIH